MSESLKENATHISKIKGVVTRTTSDPLNQGVAGLKTGEMVYRTDINERRIYDGAKWWGKAQTTTSTSSSTSTSTTISTSTTTS